MIKCLNLSVVLILLAALCTAEDHNPPEIILYEGDACVTSNYDGKCLIEKQCPNLETIMTHRGLYARDVGHCGYTVYEEIICCPEDIIDRPLSRKYFHSSETVRTTITLIITSTQIVQTEKIGEELVFSNFSMNANEH
ncbi:PREDICTED: uncharacterized protein LOC108377712 [Rhagoletis zephyria]|uniref:uncharacterized protein LOC108377712 n=1 Tax=Rhagoletis zephyria TaxID=28612 RepID=UPI000811425E|nr:PREDICTED: uncharacterized protein LOC108377712 [Rhagoletis zephyria]